MTTKIAKIRKMFIKKHIKKAKTFLKILGVHKKYLFLCITAIKYLFFSHLKKFLSKSMNKLWG